MNTVVECCTNVLSSYLAVVYQAALWDGVNINARKVSANSSMLMMALSQHSVRVD